jgi:hypothetical protein
MTSEVDQWCLCSLSLLLFAQQFQCLSALLFMITEMFMENIPSVAVWEINAAVPVCPPTAFLRCDWKVCLMMKDDYFCPCPWHSSNRLQRHGNISTLTEWISHLHYTQGQSLDISGFCVWCTQELDNTMHFFHCSLSVCLPFSIWSCTGGDICHVAVGAHTSILQSSGWLQ